MTELDEHTNAAPYALREPLKSLYVAPSEDDLATPLSFLRWYHGTMRMYLRNEIDWQDMREVMSFTPDVLEMFNA